MGAVAGATTGETLAEAQPVGVYRPRQPRASPLYRLLDEHFQTFATVYDERFAPRWGPWRRVVGEVVEKFLACGILEHGFARVRCAGCRHEYLLAFSCKCRYFCPSCHTKRLAGWSLWLEETLLAPVPHRQVVLAVPKRLRPYFLYNRGLLGDVSRVAARTLTAFIRATTGERTLSIGIVASIQTHGSLANWHPHLHLLVTDGGFRPDGTFVPLPLHDVATLTEAFRRAVLRRFVRRELLEEATALGMLAWPHSGFHVHDGVWVPAAERAFATRLARYCARHPVALGRLAYRADNGTVTYRSDKASGPTAGAETVDALEFLARVVSHIPNKGQVLQRYYGWYANRTRGIRRRAGVSEPTPAVGTEAVPAALAALRRRWAELLRRIFEVDPLRCPRCGDAMQIVAFITEPPVIDRILTHLRRQAPPALRARAPPAAPDGYPHRHLGVSRVRPRLWDLGSGVFGLRPGWLGAPLGPDPDPPALAAARSAPRSRPPAADRPAPQAPWTVHSASRTLGGPIEIPIPIRGDVAHLRLDRELQLLSVPHLCCRERCRTEPSRHRAGNRR